MHQQTHHSSERNAGLSQWTRLLTWVILAMIMWGLAMGVDQYQRRHARHYLTKTLTTWVQDQEQSIEKLAAEELIMRTYLMDKNRMPEPMYIAFSERMVRLAELPYALFYTLHDSLIYWNKGIPGVTPDQLHNLTNVRRMVRLPDGWYVPSRYSLSDSVTMYAMIPIKYEYTQTSQYLQPYFPGAEEIPGKTIISDEITDYPIVLQDGRKLAYLDFRHAAGGLPQQYIALLLFLLAGIFTLIAAHNAGSTLILNGQRQLGPLVFLAVLFGLRAISLVVDFSGHFGQMEVFYRALDHPLLSHSIGDLLINISMLLWIIIFFYREVAIPQLELLSSTSRWLIGLLNYIAIASGLLAIIFLFQILVADSELTFRFDDIFHFNTFSFLSLLAVQLLLIALFLYSYRLLLFIQQAALSLPQRMIAIAITAILSGITGWAIQIQVEPLILSGVVLMYLLISAYYVQIRTSNLTWIILWMILFSGLASGLLYYFNNTKIDQKLMVYGQQLIDPGDPVLEKTLNDFTSVIDSSMRPEEWLAGVPYIRQYFELVLAGDSLPSDMHQDWSWYLDTATFTYVLTQADKPVYRLQRYQSESKQVYKELLHQTAYKNQLTFEHIRYAILKDHRFVHGTLNDHFLFRHRDILRSQTKMFYFHGEKHRSFFLQDGPISVVVSYESSGRGAFLSLFSYLFCLLTITLFLLTVLNTVFSFLPDTLNFNLSHRLSLRNRIQFSVISLIVLSFLIIGVITIYYFNNTTRQYHEERLQRKALGVAKDLEAQLAKVDSLTQETLSGILPSMSKVHETDIDIYNENGRLILSSEPQIYTRYLTSPMIDGQAFAALLWEGKQLFIRESRLGYLTYRTAFVPLPKQQGKIMGYLAVPYYMDRSFLQRDISEFISALLNVYVFLLFIAGALAILVANSITYPISVIGEKLKQFKLGKKNEPLEWSSKDELGELITEYNRMILKLQESAELLARSEREGAWREMARQVAHEIKNPLTPMKLSLQHLQLAFKPAREEDKALLNRVSATLIEQIENLNQIASHFSNFAKIPDAHPESLIVNDLIHSVSHLFAENNPSGIQVTFALPPNPVYVFADKNQLLRVLNNLIKNAMQAIPEGRKGSVKISLEESHHQAVIAVQDNGTGIPETMWDKVFVPNFTTKSSGTGLGLAICKNIVDQMKGTITFETKNDQGTTFIVSIPVA